MDDSYDWQESYEMAYKTGEFDTPNYANNNINNSYGINNNANTDGFGKSSNSNVYYGGGCCCIAVLPVLIIAILCQMFLP